MIQDNWHHEFDPKKFLSRVNLAEFIQRNEAYNENTVTNGRSPCILCGGADSRGILLNDDSFLCERCYSEVAMISYPEQYEAQRRRFVIAREARRLAWESLRQRFECRSTGNGLVALGWVSILLMLIHPALLALTSLLLVAGYHKRAADERKVKEWLDRKSEWEESNPEPIEPELKHFHDPAACLSEKDRLVLKIFNHWPGYPPFWDYLRSVVIRRDSDRCQVTGCPSRLGLHVHHVRSVSEGGPHTPENLVTLCDFHHALEPQHGHERIWGDVKTRHFTLVRDHERTNRSRGGTHTVRAHLRRLELITIDELRELTRTYGFCCPSCRETRIKFTLSPGRNTIRVGCPTCGSSTEGPQQLTEETGPMLAEVLSVARNKGRWKARWDILTERKSATWGVWSGTAVAAKRKANRERVAASELPPKCPKCGSPMKLVKPRPTDGWRAFWGCTQFRVTGCRGSARRIPERD